MTVLRYIEHLRNSTLAVSELERVDEERRRGDMLMPGLRRDEGISQSKFKKVYSRELKELYPEVTKFINLGLLEEKGDIIKLTPAGRRLSDQVLVTFV